MYVCMYVYTRICMYVHIYIYICMSYMSFINVYPYVYTCTYRHLRVYIYIYYTYEHMYTSMHTHCIYVCVVSYTCTDTGRQMFHVAVPGLYEIYFWICTGSCRGSVSLVCAYIR